MMYLHNDKELFEEVVYATANMMKRLPTWHLAV